MTRCMFIAAAAALLAMAALSFEPAAVHPRWGARQKAGILPPAASAAVPPPRSRPIGPARASALPTLC